MFGLKKKIEALPILDLRNYTPEALRRIDSIEAVATVIIADGNDEYIEAFSDITLEAVACVITLPPDKQISSINGSAVLTDSSVKKGTLYLINGFALIYDLSEESDISIITNGTALLKKGSKVNILHANGDVAILDFDIENLKFIENKFFVDANFIKEAKADTIVASDNKIYIEDDVTADMLREKRIHFISGNKIICRKELWGYVQNNAHISNRIAESDQLVNVKTKKA